MPLFEPNQGFVRECHLISATNRAACDGQPCAHAQEAMGPKSLTIMFNGQENFETTTVNLSKKRMVSQLSLLLIHEKYSHKNLLHYIDDSLKYR